MYQRSKGRDLFDMWWAITQTNVDTSSILEAWHFYMKHEGHSISKQDFMENMEKKIADKDFAGDMNGLLRSSLEYNAQKAYQFINENLLEKI